MRQTDKSKTGNEKQDERFLSPDLRDFLMNDPDLWLILNAYAQTRRARERAVGKPNKNWKHKRNQGNSDP